RDPADPAGRARGARAEPAARPGADATRPGARGDLLRVTGPGPLALGPQKRCELVERLVQPRGVAPGPEQLELPRLAIEPRLRAADEPVAGQERQDVVAVLALRRRHVHLQPVAEIEQRLGSIAVVHEAVERRKQRDAVRNWGFAHVGVR